MKKVLLLMLICLVLPTAARAAPPVDVEGDFVYSPDCPTARLANDNLFLYCTATGTWTGDFAGTYEDEYVVVLHGSSGGFDFEMGFFRSTSTFTGVVAGKEGTLEMRMLGKSPGDINDWTGTWRIIGGTGDLANLRGQGVFWNNGELDIHYEGRIHFDP